MALKEREEKKKEQNTTVFLRLMFALLECPCVTHLTEKQTDLRFMDNIFSLVLSLQTLMKKKSKF